MSGAVSAPASYEEVLRLEVGLGQPVLGEEGAQHPWAACAFLGGHGR